MKNDHQLCTSYPTLYRILRTYEADCSDQAVDSGSESSSSTSDDHVTHSSSDSAPNSSPSNMAPQPAPCQSQSLPLTFPINHRNAQLVMNVPNQTPNLHRPAIQETSCQIVSSTTPPINRMASNRIYPTSHPMAMAKHICAICGDRASGKHYGVFSCEGCKGFFKRTVRKGLRYSCREQKKCIIDKRQRNRCQFCRYLKCQMMGMKREAVQEERSRNKRDECAGGVGEQGQGQGQGEPSSTSNYITEMPLDQIADAELVLEQNLENIQQNGCLDDVQRVESAIRQLIDWARSIPHFMELSLEDQSTLIHNGWNELILSAVAYASRQSDDQLILWPNKLVLTRSLCENVQLFDRIMNELAKKFFELKLDRTEFGCLRTIALYNPDVPGVKSSVQVEGYRELVYACLQQHCHQRYPDEPGRFAKLLLRMPSLRSVSIKCCDSLENIVPAPPAQSYLLQALTHQPVVQIKPMFS